MQGDLDEGIEAEQVAFARVFQSGGRQGGHQRLPRQAQADLDRDVSPAPETGAAPPPLASARPDGRSSASAVAELARLMRGARSVVALTGAGISVPSGIPDFRTPGTGLWANVDPMEVAHIDAWRADPERFWRFYGERFQTLEDKQPNGAHAALVELERRGILTAVITQNIDMLHRKAGTRELVEVHGTIEHASCLVCGGHLPAARDAPAADRRRPRHPALRVRGAAEAGRRAVRRVPARGRARARTRAGRRRRRAAVHRQLARGASGRPAARA